MPDDILRLRGACSLALPLAMFAACQTTHGTEVTGKQQNAAAYDPPQQIQLDGKKYWFFPKSMMYAFDAEFARLEAEADVQAKAENKKKFFHQTLPRSAAVNTCREWDNGKWHDEFVEAWNTGTVDRCQAMRSRYMQCEFAMRHRFFDSFTTRWFGKLHMAATEGENKEKYAFSSGHGSGTRPDGVSFRSARVDIGYPDLVAMILEEEKALKEQNQPTAALDEKPTTYSYRYYLPKYRFDAENQTWVPVNDGSQEFQGVVVHRVAYSQLNASRSVLNNPEFDGAQDLLLIGEKADYESHRDVAVATCEQINGAANTPTEATPEGAENPVF